MTSQMPACLPLQFYITQDVTLGNVIIVFRKLPINKAPSPNSLTNALLKGCREALVLLLSRTFIACLDTGYYLKLFKESIIVILRKP